MEEMKWMRIDSKELQDAGLRGFNVVAGMASCSTKEEVIEYTRRISKSMRELVDLKNSWDARDKGRLRKFGKKSD